MHMSSTALVFLTLGIALLDHQEEPGSMGAWLRGHPHAVAGFVAYGPVVFAAFLLVASGDSLSFRWPFAHEDVLGKFGLHFVVGFLTGVVPVYHSVVVGLGGRSAFCQIWGEGCLDAAI